MKSIHEALPIRGDLTLVIANEIIKLIQKKFNIKLSPLGSTGKKSKDQYSGDIDIAIEYDWNNYKDILDYLKESTNCIIGNINQNLHVFNIGYFYLEESIKKCVQIDFMFTDNIDYSKFAFNSPNYTRNESRYKGMYQSALLMAIISNTPNEYLIEYYDSGEIKSYWKYFLNQYKGLLIEHKSFEGKTKRLKNPTTIETKFITNNPIDIIYLCLGDKATLNTCQTFENELEFICSKDYKYFSKEQLIKIKKAFLNDWQIKLKTDESLLKEFEDLFNEKINSL